MALAASAPSLSSNGVRLLGDSAIAQICMLAAVLVKTHEGSGSKTRLQGNIERAPGLYMPLGTS